MPFLTSITGNYSFGRKSIAYSFPPVDPYFEEVVLLMHMDGTEGSTNFIDNSPNTKVITPNGAAQITTSESKFGGASAAFNNLNSYLTIPDNVDFDFGALDWTIEFFVRLTTTESDIILNKAVNLGFFPWQVRVLGSRFNVRGYDNNPVAPRLMYNLGVGKGPIISVGTWYFITIARQSSRVFFYINGVLIDYAFTTNTTGIVYYSNSVVSIGATSNGQGVIGGNIDELRITKGLCRYPNGTTFYVPLFPFQDS